MRLASSRPNGRLMLFVTQGVLVALAATALVAHAAEPARHVAKRAATPASTPTTTTTTTTTPPPPPPPRLYFTMGLEAVRDELRSIASGGGDERPEPGPVVRTEQISPDGTQIVYSKITARNDYQCPQAECPYTTTQGASLAVANRDGSGERILTTGGYDDDGAWVSSDVITYRSHRRETSGREYYELDLVDTSGNALGALTTPEVSVGSFAVAPDRRSVAYESVPKHEAKGTLVVQDLESRVIRQLAAAGFESLTWSPDGSEIAGWRIPFERSAFRQEIVAVPAAGGPVRVVYGVGPPTDNGWLGHCGSNGAYSTQVGRPVWSPDSTQLAFTSTAALTRIPAAMLHDIVVINRDGRNLRTLRHASLTCSASGNDHDNVTLHAWR